MADALKDELASDPLLRGYLGMSDQEAAADLNTSYRTRNRTSMTGDEIFQATDPGEFNGLTSGSGNSSDDQGHWLAFCGRETIDPFATANVQLVISIFGNPSTTLTNLNAARVESITRAAELRLPLLKGKLLIGYVTAARTV